MRMQIIQQILNREKLKQIALDVFGNMVKGVVDIDKGLLALNAELHADLEALLLKSGSHQKNLWGINLYPELNEPEFIEFDSMINMRPSQGNRSRGVEDAMIRKKILDVVHKWVSL